MTCFFCKGNLENSTTTHMIELEHCILIVKNVPCHRCDQCGEITLSIYAETGKRLGKNTPVHMAVL